MWHPPERIRHPLPEPGWPTAEQAESSRLFSEVGIGNLEATSRTWVPAMVPWRATDDGHVTQDVIDWYCRFAEGRPGVVVVEATGIRDIPSGPLLRIGHDRFVEGLSKLTSAVRDVSGGQTKLFIQLIDFLRIRRRPAKDKFFRRFLAVEQRHKDALAAKLGDDSWCSADDDAVRERLIELPDDQLSSVLDEREVEDVLYGFRERVWDTDQPHIRELPEVLPGLFADAAERAFKAGFDGVELHYAHAYTMASFLSARNVRDDGYGGPRENRVKLPLEVYSAVRERVGSDRVVGVRFLGDEVIERGTRIDDAVYFAERFADAGFDFLSVSKGGKFEDAKRPRVGEAVYPYTGQSGYECMPTVWSDARGPFGRNLSLARAIKKAVGERGYAGPVVAAGGIGTFDMAEKILADGDADIVAAARQSLADPDWWLKMHEGRGQDIRRCEFTNYCEGLDQKHKQVTCKLWDRKELDEPDVPLDLKGKRRLIAPRWRRGED